MRLNQQQKRTKRQKEETINSEIENTKYASVGPSLITIHQRYDTACFLVSSPEQYINIFFFSQKMEKKNNRRELVGASRPLETTKIYD